MFALPFVRNALLAGSLIAIASGLLGYFIIGVFAASWAVSIGIYKWRRLDLLEPERIES